MYNESTIKYVEKIASFRKVRKDLKYPHIEAVCLYKTEDGYLVCSFSSLLNEGPVSTVYTCGYHYAFILRTFWVWKRRIILYQQQRG